jgi:RNA polymerase-binding protein DksA
MDARKLEKFRKILLKERERQLKVLGMLEEGFDATPTEASDDLSAYPFHPADLATDAADREMNSMLATSEGEILYEIDEALRRIISKKYGKCEGCGKTINEDRLLAVPYARLCVKCKEKEEKNTWPRGG